jgi:GGDEF domain-containing protein
MIEVGEDRYREMRNQFLKCVEQDNQKVPYEFSVAIGSTVFNEKTDDDFSEFFRRTDQVMYQDKIQAKKHHEHQKKFLIY